MQHLSHGHREHARAIGHRLHHQGTSHSSSHSDLRVIQSYLRVMGYYGDPDNVTGVSVVTGHLDTRTQRACKAFAADSHGAVGAAPDGAMLHALRAANSSLPQAHLADVNLSSNYHELADAFAQAHAPNHAALKELHPIMRFPLAAALRELQGKGVPVVVLEGYRSPAMQESLVATGKSTAPPNWSFHNYGLAIDIAPHAATVKEAFDVHSAAWKTIMKVMAAHGFYSMYQHQKWDLPHFELPMKTAELQKLPTGPDGWKEIPASAIPAAWQSANAKALAGEHAPTLQASLPQRGRAATLVAER